MNNHIRFKLNFKIIQYALLIFVVLASCSCSNTKNHDLDLKSLSKAFIKHNQNLMDGYLVDMLVNDRIYGNSIFDINKSQVVYYYQSIVNISKYNSHQADSLDAAVGSIDLAIKKDAVNSFNYFVKSYLLFKKGELEEAALLFNKGIELGNFNSYQEEASLALINVAETASPLDASKSLYLAKYVEKMGIDSDLFSYIGRKLKNYFQDNTINVSDKRRTYDYVCSYASNNQKAFDLIKYPNIILINSFNKVLTDEIKQNGCDVKYDPSITKSGYEYKKMVEDYLKSKDENMIKRSAYWKNILVIKSELNNRKAVQ